MGRARGTVTKARRVMPCIELSNSRAVGYQCGSNLNGRRTMIHFRRDYLSKYTLHCVALVCSLFWSCGGEWVYQVNGVQCNKASAHELSCSWEIPNFSVWVSARASNNKDLRLLVVLQAKSRDSATNDISDFIGHDSERQFTPSSFTVSEKILSAGTASIPIHLGKTQVSAHLGAISEFHANKVRISLGRVLIGDKDLSISLGEVEVDLSRYRIWRV